LAVEAMKRGAADYVIKTSTHLHGLPVARGAALEKRRTTGSW
jgi:FixJ family two-component response regulator